MSVLSDLISRVTDAVLEEVPEVAEPTGSDAGAIIAAARAGSTGGRQGEEVGFAIDSPVEEGGFEPSVPPANELVSSAGHACAPGAKDGLGAVVYLAGTKGSNPPSSSTESVSNRSGPS